VHTDDAAQAGTRSLVAPRLRPSWPLLLGLASFTIGLLGAKRLLNDPDTYLHIAAGRWTLVHGALPTDDPFSHSLPGAPWIVHEWLSELVLALTYNGLGWQGLVVLSAACFGLAIAILARHLLDRGEVVRAERQVQGVQGLGQAVAALGPDQRDDVVAARGHPGDGQLRGGRPLVLGDRLERGEQLQVPGVVLAAEPGEAGARVVGRPPRGAGAQQAARQDPVDGDADAESFRPAFGTDDDDTDDGPSWPGRSASVVLAASSARPS